MIIYILTFNATYNYISMAAEISFFPARVSKCETPFLLQNIFFFGLSGFRTEAQNKESLI
jgi:hypothetical protein